LLAASDFKNEAQGDFVMDFKTLEASDFGAASAVSMRMSADIED